MRYLSFVLLFLCCGHTFSQGVNNIWVMGYDSKYGLPFGGMNINFVNDTMNVTYNGHKMQLGETNGVISDKNGNLLFYSNGIWIANATHDTMRNGSGLNPGDFVELHPYGLTIPQGNLVIPIPNDSMKYYLFHQTAEDYGRTDCSTNLFYSVIDMEKDFGLGEVIQKNIVLHRDSMVGGYLTGSKHANGRDWWIITHQFRTNKFLKFLISPYGIQGPFIQTIGTKRGVGLGQCVFSPDGSKFAYYDPQTHALDLFDFDRCSGDLSNLLTIPINDSAFTGGAAFSPNSKVLYVSSTLYVYQFDLSRIDIAASKTTVAVWDGYYSPKYPFATTFYQAQLAPDGKVYIVCGNGTLDFHVINNPDSVGLSCDVCQHCVHLPAYNAETIANHPNYFLGEEKGSVCDSLTDIRNISSMNVNFNIYPNPVSVNGEITFSYSSTGEQKSISILNIEGKEVARYALPQWSSIQKIKLPELEDGIYLARLFISNTSASANIKFIVQ